MIWIYLLISLTSSVCGMFVVTPTFHQTQEKNSIIISWDSRIKTDLSLANLVCFFQSEPLKVLYQMINGVEYPESQHQQFAGRLQLDRDSLREGRVRLHLSTVIAEDSGNYWCELSADYDKKMSRGGFLDTGRFVLNVAQKKDGENSDESLSSPRSGLTAAEGAEHPLGRRQQDVPGDSRSIVAPIILVVLIVGYLTWAILTSPARYVNEDPQEEFTQIKTSMDVAWSSTLSQTIKKYLTCERIQQKKLQQDPYLLQV